MKKWIDVTDLMIWKGHLTGIQRVVINIAARIQRDDNSVGLFYYDPHKRQFYEHSMNLLDWLQRSNEHVEPSQHALATKELLINATPHAIKRYTPRVVKHIAVKVGKHALTQKRKIVNLRQKMYRDGRDVAVFSAGDTVIVLGNGWDNQEMFYELGILKQKSAFKLVNVVYDLIPIFEPQYFGGLVTVQYTDYMFESATNCDLLLPISKSTDNDIMRFCNKFELPNPRSEVIRLGDEVDEIEPKRPNWIGSRSFILCVGTIEIRKNHTLLYYAYKKLVNEGTKNLPLLVIVGKKGWYTNDVIMLFEQDPEMKDYVVLVENTSDQELVWLYDNCQFTVYPSLYEGWGLPVAESLARGKVVLSTNSSSVPEAGGKYADYFSPYDAVACADLIKRYTDSSVRESREREIQDYKITPWEDTYNKVKKLISSV